MIEVSLQKGQEGLNIARRAMGHGNYKGLTDGMIMVGSGEEVIVNSDGRY
jgi:hypothetical protein